MKNSNKDLFELMLASNEDSEQFPVLKAFQSYLEAERERSRRRQSQITICFLISTIILVICFCVLGFAFFSKFIEKDNQLTEMLLLERTGRLQQQYLNNNGQQLITEPVQQNAKPEDTTPKEDEELIQLKGELASVKADLEKTQEQLLAQKQEVQNLQQNASASVPKTVKKPAALPPSKTATTTTTTTTTTTSTTTTTTTQPGPSIVNVNINNSNKANSVAPDGYETEVVGLITGNNVSVPWHILTPDTK